MQRKEREKNAFFKNKETIQCLYIISRAEREQIFSRIKKKHVILFNLTIAIKS
jgi:hypothetical protein